MKVPKKIARDIVERMKGIINYDINFIDTDNIIIASTDEERIGSFHGGARIVFATKNGVVINNDEQYPGAKQGINLPVYFENRIVGVIGITGKEEEVGRYGRIIEEMTEILVKEAYIVEQENIKRESQRQFFEELLFVAHKGEEEILKMRSELLNIKMDIPRVVIMGRIHNEFEKNLLSIPSIYEDVNKFIRRYIDFNIQNLILQSSLNYIIILDTKGLKNIESLLNNIHQGLKEKYNISICFGIGDSCIDSHGIRRSYQEAKIALDFALNLEENFILPYNELDVELLIDKIPKETREQFIQKAFKNINPQKINGYIELILEYCKYNGSIYKISESLYLHKNTVQYRLNKIKSLTGYDPRKIKDMLILYLGVLLHQVRE